MCIVSQPLEAPPCENTLQLTVVTVTVTCDACVAGAALRRLVVSHNPIGDRGLAGLAGGCPKGQGVALTELGLEDCCLGCLCAKPLGAIMQDWTSLQQLTLSWNDLGIRGK